MHRRSCHRNHDIGFLSSHVHTPQTLCMARIWIFCCHVRKVLPHHIQCNALSFYDGRMSHSPHNQSSVIVFCRADIRRILVCKVSFLEVGLLPLSLPLPLELKIILNYSFSVLSCYLSICSFFFLNLLYSIRKMKSQFKF